MAISRRKFMKLMGGIASLPVIGQLGSAPKKVSAVKKGIESVEKMTEAQSILPDLISVVMRKGKEIDSSIPNAVAKEYKGVRVYESPNEINVEFRTDTENPAFAKIEKADYIVDEKTGKSVYKPPEYEEGQQVYRAYGPDDYSKDFEFEIIDSISDVKKIAMEGKAPIDKVRTRELKSGGGLAGSPPVFETSSPSEALKEIIRRTPFLGGSGEVLPIFSNENMTIESYLGSPQDTVSYGLGAFTNRGDIMLNQLKDGDKQIGVEFGTTATPNTTFGLGYREGQGPQFGLRYEKTFAKGGLTDTIPPERGPMPQGVESLFRTR